MVWAARGAVTSGMGAIETEGGFPACAQAVPTSRASRQISYDLCRRKIIPDTPNSRAIGVQFLLSLMSLRDLRFLSRVTLWVHSLFYIVFEFSPPLQTDNSVHNLPIAPNEEG